MDTPLDRIRSVGKTHHARPTDRTLRPHQLGERLNVHGVVGRSRTAFDMARGAVQEHLQTHLVPVGVALVWNPHPTRSSSCVLRIPLMPNASIIWPVGWIPDASESYIPGGVAGGTGACDHGVEAIYGLSENIGVSLQFFPDSAILPQKR